jgi:hypothetical protein
MHPCHVPSGYQQNSKAPAPAHILLQWQRRTIDPNRVFSIADTRETLYR